MEPQRGVFKQNLFVPLHYCINRFYEIREPDFILHVYKENCVSTGYLYLNFNFTLLDITG